MIDLSSEEQTVQTFIFVANANKEFFSYAACEYDPDICHSIWCLYHVLGQTQGLSQEDAVRWARENVKFHQPTLDLIEELNIQIYRYMGSALRRDAMLHVMNEFLHMLVAERFNMDMYGRKY